MAAIPTAIAGLGTAWMEMRAGESKDLIAYQQAQLEAAYEKLDDRLREIDRLVAVNSAFIEIQLDDLATARLRMERGFIVPDADDLEELDEDGGGECTAEGCPAIEPLKPTPTKTRRRAGKAHAPRGLPKPSQAQYHKAKREQKQMLDF